MDLDRFVSANRPNWERLAELSSRAAPGVGRLTAAELDELVRLYQRAATHLSLARTTYRDPGLTAHLSTLVAKSGAVIRGTRARTLNGLARFFSTTFPAAVWHARRSVLAAVALLFLPGLATGAWIAQSSEAVEATGPAALREAYIEEDFEAYYSSDAAAAFTSNVFVNNVRVAVLAFAGGIAFCVLTGALLAFNGASVGVAAGLFTAAGQWERFWGLILPHGLLELTAVCVAGAAGLRLGWALIDPGDRPRTDALADEGRRAVAILMGLVLAFGVAALIEGTVTGSALPTSARLAVGVAAEALFVAWVVVCGRAAAAQGLTGALGESPTPLGLG